MRPFFINARQRCLKTSLLCAVLLSPTAGAQIEIHAVAASNYVVQGISQTRGDPSLQAGLNYGHPSGFYAGLWIAENKLFMPEETVREVDYYLGWRIPTGSGGNWTATLSHYSYPDQPHYFDYQYNELAVTWQTGSGFSATLGINDNFYGWERNSRFAEVAYEFAASEKLLFNTGLGYHDTGDIFGRDYRYWHVGVARVLDHFTIDLSLVGTDDNAEYIFGNDAAGQRWVLSVIAKVF